MYKDGFHDFTLLFPNGRDERFDECQCGFLRWHHDMERREYLELILTGKLEEFLQDHGKRREEDETI